MKLFRLHIVIRVKRPDPVFGEIIVRRQPRVVGRRIQCFRDDKFRIDVDADRIGALSK